MNKKSHLISLSIANKVTMSKECSCCHCDRTTAQHFLIIKALLVDVPKTVMILLDLTQITAFFLQHNLDNLTKLLDFNINISGEATTAPLLQRNFSIWMIFFHLFARRRTHHNAIVVTRPSRVVRRRFVSYKAGKPEKLFW